MSRETFIAMQETNGCGCSNRRMCRKHWLAAMKLLGDPCEGVTAKAQEPYEYSEDKK